MIGRIVLFFAATVWLTGCGNCNMLGGGRLPARCEAGLGAGAVLLAPVAIPMAIADDARASSGRVRPAGKNGGLRPSAAGE